MQACRNGTTIIEFLVGIAEMAIGLDPLHRLVSRAETPDAVLWRVLAAARQAEMDVGVLPGVKEREQELLKFQLAQAPAAQIEKLLGVATHEDALKSLARFDAAFAAQMVRPIHELIGTEAPLAKALLAEAAGHPGLVGSLPALQSLVEKYARSLLMLRALQTRAAIALYARGHGGKPPERLGDLVPGYLLCIPRDIHVEAPLHYARTDNGWKLWSVGPDKKDDGGAGDVRDPWRSPDIVFYSFIETNEEKHSGLVYEFDENGQLALYKTPERAR